MRQDVGESLLPERANHLKRSVFMRRIDKDVVAWLYAQLGHCVMGFVHRSHSHTPLEPFIHPKRTRIMNRQSRLCKRKMGAYGTLTFGVMVSVAGCGGDTGTGPDPNDQSNSRANPAGVGETVQGRVTGFISGSGTVRLTLLSIVSGQAALDIVLDANPFNDLPSTGQEYVLARFRAEVVSTDLATAFDMWDGDWEADVSGTLNDDALLAVCCLDDEALEREVFAGASWEGYVPFMVSAGQPALAVYQRGRGDLWFRLR